MEQQGCQADAYSNIKIVIIVWNEVDAGWFSLLTKLDGVGLWAPGRSVPDDTVVIDAAGVDNMEVRC